MAAIPLGPDHSAGPLDVNASDGFVAGPSNAYGLSVSPAGELQARFKMSALPMSRHEHWRLAYRENRYCRRLTQDELNQRIRDIFLNMLRLTPEGKVGLPAMSAQAIQWMVSWTHVLEEMKLRHGPYPKGFTSDILHREPYPDFAGTLAQTAASVLSSRAVASQDLLIKYGRPHFMTALYEHGRFRVQSASYYGRADHNGAVRDDELALQISLSVRRDDVCKVVSNPEEVPPEYPGQRMNFRYEHPIDYWVYCLTSSVEPRLFVDFNALACVVVRNRSEFIRRLKAVEGRFFPGARVHAGAAEYIDPCRPAGARIFLPMSKHFRYAYQQEFRIVWEPSTRQKKIGRAHV